LRIIHAVSLSPQDSMGVYQAVRELAVGQAELGHEVHIAVNGRWPDDGVAALGVTLHDGGLRDSRATIRSLASPSLVVHTHSTWTLSTLLPLAFPARSAPVFVASPHGSLAPEALRARWLKKKMAWPVLFRPAMKRHRAIFATSEKERAEIEAQRLGRPVPIIPNGISAPEAGLIDSVAKQRKIGFLGRIHPNKGVIPLVRAWAAVARDFPDWRLELSGPEADRRYAQQVRELAAATERVACLGPLYGGDRWRFLAESEVVAVPSRTENFCYVVAEAYLAGSPVLTTFGVPWPEIDELGLGWRGAATEEGLGAMLRRAMESGDAERGAMAARGRAFVLSRLSRSAVAMRTVEAYEDLL
jgi:glycosyltransferase involved in cell wall biosynthesis